MHKILDVHAVLQGFACRGAVLLALTRVFGWKPFRRKRPFQPKPSDIEPFTLVLLADREKAAGRDDDARCLLDAAYVAYDCRCREITELRGD